VLEISAVAPGSTADGLGLKRGDSVRAVNGRLVNDVIDFCFFAADERIRIDIVTHGGKARTVSLRKKPDDMLGLEFAQMRVRRCGNKCIFCFVDQMPPGCRKSLYVKDDDYRASFLYGNFITLGSLAEQDWQRIFNLRLSPLYISVHATDPVLRSFILGNRKAPDILSGLRRLADGGIRMHTQIVLCPGINDGSNLIRTLSDLAELIPSVASVAVVPAGRTAFRKRLFPLEAVTAKKAREVIDMTSAFGRSMKKRHGSRIVYASDEFFIKARMPFPPKSYYEDFPQIENGVGMVAEFLHNAAKVRFPDRVKPLSITLVTGVSFRNVLESVAARLKHIAGLTCRVVTVRNAFFGPTVTVAGLLTASDIIAAFRGKRRSDLVIIPAEALREGDTVFLDNKDMAYLERELKIPVRTAANCKDIAMLLRKAG
jgi:putative radical SAM enzyme (TIGR03279 family)